ncbi:MAG: hypothetical protein HZC41_01730 [Chloroflexi bacterium]|nr:hypothetical protein [Chloroflexota bacterium]
MSVRTRLLLVAIAGLIALMSAASMAGAQEDTAASLRRVSVPDLGSFEYPLALYSVRAGMLPPAASETLLFPGAVSVEPNDSFVYQDDQGVVYRLTLAAFVDESVTADTDPASRLGQSPLLPYEASALDSLDVATVTIGGLPAARVNDLPAGVVNQAGVAAHIVAVAPGRVLELVVEPVMLFGAPNHNEPMAGDTDMNRSLYEDILASLEFNQ